MQGKRVPGVTGNNTGKQLAGIEDIVLILIIVALALFLGVIGYRYVARLEWIDSIHNASMILSSMGPVSEMPDTEAKLFSSFYALLSGLVLVVIIGYLLSKLL